MGRSSYTKHKYFLFRPYETEVGPAIQTIDMGLALFFSPTSVVEGKELVPSVHLSVCLSVCLSVSALSAEPFDIRKLVVMMKGHLGQGLR